MAKMASLTTDAPAAVRSDALALAHQMVMLGTNDLNRPWQQLALGLAEFRAGNFPAAEAAFAVAAQPIANETAQNNVRRTGTAAFYQSLVLHRQGRTTEAREAFRAAKALLGGSASK